MVYSVTFIYSGTLANGEVLVQISSAVLCLGLKLRILIFFFFFFFAFQESPGRLNFSFSKHVNSLAFFCDY